MFTIVQEFCSPLVSCMCGLCQSLLQLVAVTEDSVLVPRHLLVLINPVGGQGRAVAEFTQHVQPLFDLAEINYNIVVTGK